MAKGLVAKVSIAFLELKADDVQDMKRNTVAFGVKALNVPDPTSMSIPW